MSDRRSRSGKSPRSDKRSRADKSSRSSKPSRSEKHSNSEKRSSSMNSKRSGRESSKSPPLVFSAPPSVPVPARMLAWNAPRTDGGFRVIRVKGDGRCLYRSIARSLAYVENRSLTPQLETEDADALRNVAYKTICNDRAEEFRRKNIVEGSLRSYCAQMRNPSFYAGEAEILALSDAMKIPISVFLEVAGGRLKSIATYGQKYTKSAKGRVIRVVYNGVNHYNAVVPR